MKYVVRLIPLLGLTFAVFCLQAQDALPQQQDTLRFRVSGACDMCEQRIEQLVRRKGIFRAYLSAERQLQTLIYKPAVVEPIRLDLSNAQSGHDTKIRKSRKAAYESFPECCRYRGNSGNMHAGGEGLSVGYPLSEKLTAVVEGDSLVGIKLQHSVGE